jgi:hypothetical protein
MDNHLPKQLIISRRERTEEQGAQRVQGSTNYANIQILQDFIDVLKEVDAQKCLEIVENM